MRRSLLWGVLWLTLDARAAGTPEVVPLWPTGAPGSEGRLARVESLVKGHLTNIHQPSLTPFLPASGTATGTAVIIAPGGGHRFLLIGPEGNDLARLLAARGIAAFVLRYRLANDDAGPSGYQVKVHALADIQRAIRLVRQRAAGWNIDPAKVGVIGFSAGGELAFLAGTRFEAGRPDASDPVEREGSRPDFQALIYPGGLPADFEPPKDMPPAFLLCAYDDRPKVAPLAGLFLQLQAAGIPAELHVYGRGGHGFGVRDRPMPVTRWPERLLEWMADMGMPVRP